MTQYLTELVLAGGRQGRDLLIERVSSLCGELYQTFRAGFIMRLSPEQRTLYQNVGRVPYAARDWWRDIHDVIVTSYMGQIVAAKSDLPRWLVTAALVHDRGYAVLAWNEGQQSRSCNEMGSERAHWENVDMRIQHSLLSRLLMNRVLAVEPAHSPEVAIVDAAMEAHQIVHQPEVGIPSEEMTTFLDVIEHHDYPNIGRWAEIGLMTRHHYDADSLYSISVTSFVKDWLYYISDPKKVGPIMAILGRDAESSLDVDLLLSYRLARYYKHESELPIGWPVESFPLIPQLVTVSEGGTCIRPSSVMAQQCTNASFQRLAKLCFELREAASIEAATEVIRAHATEELTSLD